MKKYIFSAIALALLMSSCSQDEVIATSGNEISFIAVAENTSRAVTSYCSANMPEKFTVWASHSSNAHYIDGAKVVQNGSDYVFADGYTRYWPSDKLNFFAFHNDGGSFDPSTIPAVPTSASEPSCPTFKNFCVKDNVDEQVDFIYAINRSVTKSAGPVVLNFRHALSQVVFRGEIASDNIKVEVSAISVGHVSGSGTFTIPNTASNTTTNWKHTYHDDTDFAGPAAAKTPPTWGALGNPDKKYTVTFPTPIVVDDVDQQAIFTASPTGHSGSANWNDVMILMPQTQPAWSGNTDIDNADGAYFAVTCKVFNVATINDEKIEYELFDDVLYIPCNINWQPGYRYVYNLEFGAGDAAITSTGEEALTKINLTMSVEDFQSADTQTINDISRTVNYHLSQTDVTTINTVKSTGSAWYVLAMSSIPSTYTPSGSKLAGWSLSNELSSIDYQPGEAIFQGLDVEQLDLYAVVKKAALISYRCSSSATYYEISYFEGDDGNIYVDEFPDYEYFRTLDGNNWPEIAEGKTFKGWARYGDTTPYSAPYRLTAGQQLPLYPIFQ